MKVIKPETIKIEMEEKEINLLTQTTLILETLLETMEDYKCDTLFMTNDDGEQEDIKVADIKNIIADLEFLIDIDEMA